MKVNIFCHVIDFWGDIAVSWRCAKALKLIRPSWEITYFCDDWTRWYDLLGVQGDFKIYDRVILKDFVMGMYEAGDIAIACLSCDFPENHHSNYFVNLEYLSIDIATVGIHKQRSWPYSKYFFVPGIFKGTGGLIFGNFFQKRFLRENLYQSRYLFCQRKQICIDVKKTWISSYLYNCDWKRIQIPDDIVIIGPSRSQVDLVFKNQIFLDLSLEDYDELLWLCDQHYVRGEDSLSRAILMGKPFLWQAYSEESDSHHRKVMTLLDAIFCEKLHHDETIRIVYEDLNKKGFFSWSQWDCLCQKYELDFRNFARRVFALGSQEENLAIFIEDLVKTSCFHQ